MLLKKKVVVKIPSRNMASMC